MDIRQEIQAAVAKIPQGQPRTFQGTEEFYEFLRGEGVTASLADVRAAVIDLAKQQKQELVLEELDAVAGGSQVEVKNTVKDNEHPVTIGPTVVINM